MASCSAWGMLPTPSCVCGRRDEGGQTSLAEGRLRRVSWRGTDGVEKEEEEEEDGKRERGRGGAGSRNAQDVDGKRARTSATISSAAVAASCSCRGLLGMLGGMALCWCCGREGARELSLHAGGMTRRRKTSQESKTHEQQATKTATISPCGTVHAYAAVVHVLVNAGTFVWWAWHCETQEDGTHYSTEAASMTTRRTRPAKDRGLL